MSQLFDFSKLRKYQNFKFFDFSKISKFSKFSEMHHYVDTGRGFDVLVYLLGQPAFIGYPRGSCSRDP